MKNIIDLNRDEILFVCGGIDPGLFVKKIGDFVGLVVGGSLGLLRVINRLSPVLSSDAGANPGFEDASNNSMFVAFAEGFVIAIFFKKIFSYFWGRLVDYVIERYS